MTPGMTEEQKQALRAARSPQRNYTREEAYAQMDGMTGRTKEKGAMPVPEQRPVPNNQTGNSE